MGKQVIAAAIFNDEAVSLGIIEPFDFASWHDELPCSFAVTLGGADCSSVLGARVWRASSRGSAGAPLLLVLCVEFTAPWWRLNCCQQRETGIGCGFRLHDEA
jgi:hypothetical protein